MEYLFGIVSGIVASLGMGGGTILIMLLNIFTNIKQHIIQGINLIFFIPTSIVAIIQNIKNKNIDYKLASYITVPGLFGTIFGVFFSFKLDNFGIKKFFGFFLLGIAFFELFSFIKQYRFNQNDNNK